MNRILTNDEKRNEVDSLVGIWVCDWCKTTDQIKRKSEATECMLDSLIFTHFVQQINVENNNSAENED